MLPRGPWELTSDPPPLASAKKEQKTLEPAVDRPGFFETEQAGGPAFNGATLGRGYFVVALISCFV